MNIKFVTLCICISFILLSSLWTVQNTDNSISEYLVNNISFGNSVFDFVEYRVFQEIVYKYNAIKDSSNYNIKDMMFTIKEYFTFYEFWLYEKDDDQVLIRNRIYKTDSEKEMKYSYYESLELLSTSDGNSWIEAPFEIVRIPPRFVIKSMPVSFLEVFDEIVIYADQTGLDFIEESAEWHVDLIYNKLHKYIEFLISQPWDKTIIDSNGMEKAISKKGYISIRYNMELEITDKVSEFK